MKIVYLKVDGTATIESAKVDERLIEMPDGLHPYTNDSVWQDAERKRPPMVFIIQGVRAPYGGTMEREDIQTVLYDMELQERAFKSQSISRIWWRAFSRFGDWLLKYGVILSIVILVGWALYQTFVPGGI